MKSQITIKSQLLIVLCHEWNYFKALKRFRFSLLIFTLAPAIFLLLDNYYFSEINLYYPIAVMALGIPRITVSLLAYSIGGEKVYKTFEPLLSTPLNTISMFLGKILLPFLFSLALLILSAFISCLTANLLLYFQPGASKVLFFSAAQVILIFDNLMLCFLMIFVTGILTLLMSKPRQGVLIASGFSFLLIMPSIFVGFVVQNKFIWSVGICVVLILINVFLTGFVLKKIKRPQLMARI